MPIGPGGYEISISITTPHRTVDVAFAPLSWGLGIHHLIDFDGVLLQVGPIKFRAQETIWAQ